METRSTTKLALFATLTLAPALALGQTFQVSGFGDIAVTGQSRRTNAAGNQATVAALSSGAWQSSRLSLHGKVPVDDELSGIYDAATTLGLNAGTILNTGSVSGGTLNAFRLFDRNAYAGIASVHFGTLTAGRQATVLAESLWVTDPLRANAGATNPNVRLGYLAGPGSLIQTRFGPDTATNTNGNALDRQDNMVKYAYRANGFTGLATYAFGAVAGHAEKSNSSGAMLGYDQEHLSVRAAGAQFNDGFGSALYGVTAGAVGRLGPVQLKATYSANAVDATATYGKLRTDVWSAGVTWAALPKLDLTAAYYGIRRTQDATATQEATKLYLVPEWKLSKTFMLYGIADYELFGAAGSALDTGTPLPAGTRSSIYLALGLSFAFGA